MNLAQRGIRRLFESLLCQSQVEKQTLSNLIDLQNQI